MIISIQFRFNCRSQLIFNAPTETFKLKHHLNSGGQVDIVSFEKYLLLYVGWADRDRCLEFQFILEFIGDASI